MKDECEFDLCKNILTSLSAVASSSLTKIMRMPLKNQLYDASVAIKLFRVMEGAKGLSQNEQQCIDCRKMSC